MILYYAVGGGLGHLTRGRRVLEALGIEAAFVTASPHAADARVTRGRPFIRVPAHLEGDAGAHRAFLRGLACERLIVDTFPCGIQGELCGLDVPMDLVARRVRWAEYRREVPGPLPPFGTLYRVEDLEPAEEEELVWSAEATLPLSSSCESESGGLDAARHILIVHSGPEHEVRELVAYAGELRTTERVLVATRCDLDLPDGFERIDAYPVTHLYPRAAKIISAAGFNVMLETSAYRDRHFVVPFPRKFDDQFHRAAARKRFAPPVVNMYP